MPKEEKMKCRECGKKIEYWYITRWDDGSINCEDCGWGKGVLENLNNLKRR